MERKMKRLLSILLSLVMVLSTLTGIIPGMSLTAYADTPYGSYLVNDEDDSDSLPGKVVHFNGFDWYIIKDESTSATSGTVTLLAQGTAFGTAKFHDSYPAPNSYASSTLKGYLDSIVAGTAGTGNPDFSGVASVINDAGNGKLYLLSVDEAERVPRAVLKADFPDGGYQKGWWLRTSLDEGNYDFVRIVTGDLGLVVLSPTYDEELGVRPALKLDLSKVTFDSSTKKFELTPVVEYPLWVGGVQVTSANKDDVLGDTDEGTTVVFTPAVDDNAATTDVNESSPATLVLNGADISGGNNDSEYAAIYAKGLDLTINVTENSTVTGPETNGLDDNSEGIYIDDGCLTIKGSGRLTTTGGESANGYGCSYGIYVDRAVTINGPLNASGGETQDAMSCGIYAADVTVRSSGTLAASGGTGEAGSCGIWAGNVTVDGSLSAIGNSQAISGTVKNSVAGTGWTDTEGTTGKASIAVSEAGQELNSYKKVQFPAVPDPVAYIDHNATTGTAETKACTSYTAFVEGTNSTLTTIPAGWYVILSGNAVATNRLVVNGTVNLILCDGATLIARKGITVTSGNTLNIYAGSIDETILGTGKLYAGTVNGTINTCEGEYAGIGGSNGASGGTVTIHGGEVTALGNTKAAGIGGGNGGAGGTVTIYGGTVTASGDGQGKGMGIGAGHGGSGNGTLTIGTGLAVFTSNDNSNWTDTTSSLTTRTHYMKVVSTVPVTVVSLDKTDAQTINVGGSVSFNATVTPDGATDKTVKWSVGGTNASAVALYSDETCETPVTLDTATETMTVYAKGISVGSATVTCTSNADSTKSASCDVTVNEAAPSKLTLNVGENGKVVMNSGTYGNCSGTSVFVVSEFDLTGTLNVETDYFINVNEGASINVLSGGKVSFYPAANNTGTITAVPADGYAFTGWYNGETLYSDNAELEYKNISEDLDLTAQFASTALTPVVSDFTYSAPSDLTYDGTAKTATVVPKEGVTGMGQVTVKYYSNPECTAELVGSPTNVGTYYVGITVTEGDNYSAVSTVLHDSSWQFTIGKATPTADDFNFTAPSSRGYDGTDKTATVVPGSGVTGMGNVTVKYYSDAACTDVVENPKNVGTYYVGITVTEGDNYNAITSVLHDSNWKFTICKVNPSASDFTYIAPADLDYDDTAKSATVSAASGITGIGAVTVKYYSDAACTTVAVPKNAGTYYVGITVTEGDNYNAAATVLHGEDWKFTICKINPTASDFIYAAPADLDYDDTAKSATVTAASTAKGMGTVSVKYYSDAACSTEAEPVNVGTYYVGITVTEGDNYNAAAAVLHGEDWKFTIGKITPNANDFVFTAPSDLNYDGTAKSATVTAVSSAKGMGEVTVKYYSDVACSTEAEPVNVGTYYVGITVTEGDNYNATTAVLHGEDWKFTIGKINPAASDFTYAAPSDLNYDGTAKSATVTAASGITGIGAVTVKYYSDAACTTVAVPKNAGTYYVGITVTEGDNYNAAATVLHGEDWKFTICKINPTASDFIYAAPADLDYDDTAKSATVTAASTAKGMGTVSVKYYSDAACSTEAEPVNVGTYYVGITVTEGDNYNAAAAVLHGEDWKFTIGKITPNANDFVFTAPSDLNYDGTAKSATVTAVSSAKGMGEVTVKYYSDVACSTEAEPVNVGTYYVGITVTEGDNYNATTAVLHGEDWKFTINRTNATSSTITVNNRTYDGTEKPLVTEDKSTLVGGEMWYALGENATTVPADNIYTTTIPTATDAGTYYVWYKVVGDANHFDSEAKCIESIIKEQPKDEPKDEPKEEPKETPKETDVTPEVEENTEDNSSEEVPTETQSPYRTEWVDGQWYDSEGNATYKPQGKWYQDSTGWWYQDEDGWYPSSQWQKIDGKWYYFTSDGYMDYSEYRDGFWLGSDGAWVETYYGGGWGEKDGQFWYEDASGWYPVSQWLWINGKCYYFGSDGYRVYNQYVDGYWVNNDGEWEP